jgi:hypothetical protein
MVCRQGAGLIDGGVTVLERWAFLAKMLLAHGRQDDHDVVLSQKAVYNVPFRPKLPKELSLEWWTGDCAIEFLRNRDRSKPFFAHFQFSAAARAYHAARAIRHDVPPEDVPLPPSAREDLSGRPMEQQAATKRSGYPVSSPGPGQAAPDHGDVLRSDHADRS